MEMKSPKVTVDIETGVDEKKPKRCCGGLRDRWAALPTWQKVAIILTIIAIAVVVTVIVILYGLAPLIAQDNVNNSRFVMETVVMKSPNGQTVQVEALTTLYDAGSMAGTVKSALVTVSYAGIPFGNMVLPSIQIKANKPSSVVMDSPLTVFNNAVFALAAKSILAGNAVIWNFSGRITVTADYLPDMRLNLNKDVVIPGIDITANTAFDVVIVGGATAGILNTTVSQTFVTTSINQLQDIGRVEFDLYANNKAGNSTKIGKVTVDDFQIVQGFNQLQNVKVDLIQGTNNTDAVEAIRILLGNYNSGKPTNLIIQGPTACASPFFLNTATLPAVLNGAEMHTLAVAANINLQSVLGGGVYLTAYNPYNLPVTQTKMDFQIGLKNPLPAYTYTSLHNSTNAICPPTTTFSRLYQGTVPSAVIPGGSLTNFFLNLGPVPGQSPECFASAAQAIMCIQTTNGQSYFEVSTKGTMEISFGNFNSVIDYEQPLAPTFFESLVYYAANAEYQCANYNFTENKQYVPVLNACPIDGASLAKQTTVVAAGDISTAEKDWVLARKSAINSPANGQNASAWMTYLNNLNLAGFNSSQNLPVPTIAIAASGGGYRAMFASMGVLSALDVRNADAVGNATGGLLQSATYFAGLSGGGWTVGSIYDADFKPANVLANSFGSFNFWKPNAEEGTMGVAEGWADVIFRTATKKFAGFDVSLTDLWGQMLSKQMMQSMDTRFSDLLTSGVVNSFEAPLPILTAAQVYPNDKNSSRPHVISFSPLSGEIAGIGGGNNTEGITAYFSTQYMGTVVNNGIPTNADQCVTNMDNLGFIVGMESAAFEITVADAIDSVCQSLVDSKMEVASYIGGNVCGDLLSFLEYKTTGSQLCNSLITSGILPIPESFVPIIENAICGDIPNNVTTVDEMCTEIQVDIVPKIDSLLEVYCSFVLQNDTKCQALNATLQGVIAEIPMGCKVLKIVQGVVNKFGYFRIPPASFANPFYGIPQIAQAEPRLASEPTIAGIDGEFASSMGIPFWPLLQAERAVDLIIAIDAGSDTAQNLPNGKAIVNAAAYASEFARPFPAVPTMAQFNDASNQLLNKTTFFGCGDASVPTVVYIPNRFVTYNAAAMPGTLQLSYEQQQIDELLMNAFATTTGFVNQPTLAKAIGCAVLDAGAQPLPQGCTDIDWTSFCWKK